jgi:hypothetical protein
MSVWAEGAWQFGKYRNIPSATVSARKANREAYALDLGAEYSFTDIKWTPKLGAEYLYLSGENPNSVSGEWKGWDPVYRGKFDNYIADFRNITKTTAFDDANSVNANGTNNGTTNEQQIAVIGALNPMTDVKVDARYAYLLFNELPIANRSDKLGQEIDAKVTYDYTDDVSFVVAGGIFVPGSYYPNDQDENAGQLIASVKVDF